MAPGFVLRPCRFHHIRQDAHQLELSRIGLLRQLAQAGHFAQAGRAIGAPDIHHGQLCPTKDFLRNRFPVQVGGRKGRDGRHGRRAIRTKRRRHHRRNQRANVSGICLHQRQHRVIPRRSRSIGITVKGKVARRSKGGTRIRAFLVLTDHLDAVYQEILLLPDSPAAPQWW